MYVAFLLLLIIKKGQLAEENMKSNNSMAILGDSLSVLKKMKDKSVQLIFADAPYNIGKDFGNNSDKWESVYAYIDWCPLIRILFTFPACIAD